MKPQEEKSLDFYKKSFYQWGAIVFICIFLCFVFKLVSFVKDVAILLGFSVLMSYMLVGLVDWIQKKTFIKKRILAVFVLYLLLFLIAVLFLIFVFPQVLKQTKLLIDQAPSFLLQLDYFFENNQFLSYLDIDTRKLLTKNIDKIQEFSLEALPQIWGLAFDTIHFAIYFLVTIVISIYFLIDAHKIWAILIRPLNVKYLKHAENLRADLSKCLRGYYIGQVQLSALCALFVFIIYLFLIPKYAVLLSFWQFLVTIVPTVGGIVGILTGAFVLILMGSPIKALIAFILYMSYLHFFKDNYLVPTIMSDAINLHPVIILIVILMGAQIGGLVGIIFALPVAGVFNVLLNYYLQYRHTSKS